MAWPKIDTYFPVVLEEGKHEKLGRDSMIEAVIGKHDVVGEKSIDLIDTVAVRRGIGKTESGIEEREGGGCMSSASGIV